MTPHELDQQAAWRLRYSSREVFAQAMDNLWRAGNGQDVRDWLAWAGGHALRAEIYPRPQWPDGPTLSVPGELWQHWNGELVVVPMDGSGIKLGLAH